jgi:hypothetical protein
MENQIKNLERIILGDDNLDFAKASFPYIPNSTTEFVNNPEELIEKAKTGEYSMVITDLDYSLRGAEGFQVLEALKDSNARKILWTGRASEQEVRTKGQELGAEVLDKDELGSLVGQVVSKAPLKTDGDILVYVPPPHQTTQRALSRALKVLCDNPRIVVSSNLKEELSSDKYGLVIDISPVINSIKQGTVTHDMKYLKLKEVPRVTCVNNISTIVPDIVTHINNYLNKQGER